MIVRAENITRRIDSLGRVTLPKGIRDRMGFKEAQELELYIINYEGREYIGLAIPEDENNGKWRQAVQALEELGLDIPEKLAEKVK